MSVPYRVELTEEADQQLRALPAKVQRQVVRKLRSLSRDPRPPQSKRLENALHLHRLRSGDYRILYQIEDEVMLVLAVRIAHRRKAYRRVPSRRKPRRS